MVSWIYTVNCKSVSTVDTRVPRYGALIARHGMADPGGRDDWTAIEAGVMVTLSCSHDTHTVCIEHTVLAYC